jgi:hypothetical protein
VTQLQQYPVSNFCYAPSSMEIDLYLPSFRTMRKRSRSRSPTPCEHDRPLVRFLRTSASRLFDTIGSYNRSAYPCHHSPLAIVLAKLLRLSRLLIRRVLYHPHKHRHHHLPSSSFRVPGNQHIFARQTRMGSSRMSGWPSHAT